MVRPSAFTSANTFTRIVPIKIRITESLWTLRLRAPTSLTATFPTGRESCIQMDLVVELTEAEWKRIEPKLEAQVNGYGYGDSI